MCRSIKTLRRADEPPTDEEIRAGLADAVETLAGEIRARQDAQAVA